MDTIMLVFSVVIISAAVFMPSEVRAQLSEGDSCSGDNGQTWTCKKLQHCPSAKAEIKYKRPKPCGISADSFIVCCNPTMPSKPPPDNNFNKPPQQQTPPPFKPTKRPQSNLPLTTSEIKCRDYQKYVFKDVNYSVLGLEVDYEDDLPKHSNRSSENTCGFKEDALIYDGKPAHPREFPHQVLLGYEVRRNIEWSCAGSLISERYILTAAHCIDTDRGPPKWVRTGDLDYVSTADRANPQQIRVAKHIAHPAYKTEKPFNDIGLLRLERDVKLDEYSRPACLYNDRYLPQANATASGWGFTESGSKSTTLLKVQLEIIERDTCNEYYKENVQIDDNRMICAGDLYGRKDTCRGDSGGPLQVRRTTPYCMYNIIGVTSIGRGKCGTKKPGVYTRVSHYLPWIEKIVWP
ncbi:serine protease snake isoform X4 [Nilaparvata lugens]|uniref:serine protease snake isoform X3 n=2 Tax=Nilaparvata lugens TaxID=108931 RepID=UPI000B99C54D|nr:serine protease snake isoform X3 [Nilaparvata lugens]XP_039282038.1 serine protease snake isoform X4 [Nilaparvata lugens]